MSGKYVTRVSTVDSNTRVRAGEETLEMKETEGGGEKMRTDGLPVHYRNTEVRKL